MHVRTENHDGVNSGPRASRLREQGFLNLHRKAAFRILAALLVIYLLRVPVWIPLADTLMWGFQIAGVILVFLGIIGRVVSTLSIGGRKDREIVTTEFYSVCRNPLYFSSFLMAIGLGLLSGRVDFLILIALAYLSIFYPMMRNEAKFLKMRFPEYEEYERRVPLFVPNFGLWSERRQIQVDFKLVRRTLLEALIALPVVVLMLVISAFTQ